VDKFVKDPGAVLDYTWDWADFLQDGEAIAEKAVTSDTPELVVDSQAANDTQVTAWLSGGLDEQECIVTCRITTTQDRTDERSIYVLVYNR